MSGTRDQLAHRDRWHRRDRRTCRPGSAAGVRAAARALLLIACALVDACALRSPAGDASGTAALTGGLHESGGHYRLGRPFGDFYDSAFVLTNGGRTHPRVLSLRQAAAELSAADVVVYGERHGHPGVHLQEMKMLRALVERDPHWIVSFEQFERDVQGVVDDYLNGKIGETTLTGKGRAWNNYAASYRPLLLYASDHHLPVVAAEAPDWAISCIGQWGTGILDQFTPLERSYVAARVNVEPGPYRDKFMGFMGSSPAHAVPASSDASARAERSFSAQVVRDDTMAESIIDALHRHPGYKLLHFTGSFHAEGFLGTVERLRQLDPQLNVAVIDPVEVEDPRKPGFAADDLQGGTLLQLIAPSPDAFVEGEDTSAMTTQMTHAHEMSHCRYSPPGTPAPASPPATQEESARHR